MNTTDKLRKGSDQQSASDNASRIRQIAELFQICGNITEIIPWGNGLTNDTYRVNTNSGTDYLMQRMNETVLWDIDGMMQNIDMVTRLIGQQIFTLRNGEVKKSLFLIPLKDGQLYARTPQGLFRMYNFMQDSYSIERAEDPMDVLKAGVLLAQFHYLLRDFPVEKLIIFHPDYHNPVKHYQRLKEAAEEDRLGRLSDVTEDLSFFPPYEKYFDYFNQALSEGRLPLRVNHNDPKINNIMFDVGMQEPICMVDLDTVMPGPLAYDFGDAVRSIMCTGKDRGPDTDISAVTFDRQLYDYFYRGFMEGELGMLTEEEKRTLPMGVLVIVLESAIRYLTDYLNGDIILKVRYPRQNLVKARMHMRLAEDLIGKLELKP